MDARWDKAAPFYSRPGLHIEIYDPSTVNSFNEDVPFLIGQAKQAGGPVLEIASGTGRAAWPMGEAGFEVVGLDLNPGMIAAAEAKRSGYPDEVSDRVRFVQGDMTGFDLDQRFRFIYITYRSFQALLTPEAQRACLRCIWQHLEPGGRLVINLFDPKLSKCDAGVDGEYEEEVVANPLTGMDVEQRSIERVNDPLSQTFKMLWLLQEKDGGGVIVREEYERLDLRWTYRFEMRYLLELCGFDVEAEYGDFEKSPPMYGKEQVWVAAKPDAAS